MVELPCYWSVLYEPNVARLVQGLGEAWLLMCSVCPPTVLATAQWHSSFVTAPWPCHSNALFPLTPMRLLSVILVFLMSSDPSLVLPVPFMPWTFSNSHASSHMPQMSVTASLLQDFWLHSTFAVLIYMNIHTHIYVQKYLPCFPCSLPNFI